MAPITTFLGGSKSDSREVLASVSLDATNTPFSSSECSVNSSNRSGKAHNKCSCVGTMFFFFFLIVLWVSIGSRNWFPNTGMLVLRRRVIAGRDEESSDVSFGNDVGDVLALELEEPVDNAGTTIGT